MFGFLKDKLKNAIGKFSKDVEKEVVVEKKEVIIEEKIPPKKSIPIVEAPKEEKKGFFQKIFGKRESEERIAEKEELIEELEGVNDTPQIAPEEKKPEAITIKSIIAPVVAQKPVVQKASIQKSLPATQKSDSVIKINKVVEPDTQKPIIEEEDPKNILPIQKVGQAIKKVEDTQVTAEATSIQTKTKTILSTDDIASISPKASFKESEEKKGFFTKVTETFTKFNLSEEKFEELFWELEVVLLENNVAVEVIEKIKADLRNELMHDKISRKGVEELILSTLRRSITELFDVERINIIERIKHKRKEKQPYIIAVIGVNGSGKTTSIAKLAHKFQKQGFKVVLAASDTFRAAAIQQLEEHANNLNIKLIKHDYNSDPAAVAFDAIKYAKAHDMDVVIIDTAGRLHSNTNLMKELEKVVRVCQPDIKIFVGESITGNDCVEQAKEFDKAVGIDAIILAKADVDEKGGAAISVSYILQRPILYLGTGQTYDDLKDFDSKLIIESLEL